MRRRVLLTALAALPLAAAPAARAATPPGTIVIAKQIDDILTLDPGEDYELSGVQMDTNIYDRLLRYEAEDVTKLVGGVAESWTISPDGKVFTFKLRPNQMFQDGNPVTAEDAAFSLQRVVILDKTPAFLLNQLGWTKDNVKDLVKATAPDTLQFTITADLAPSLVLNLMTSIVASVVEKKVALEHEENGDLGNGWLKTHAAASGAYKLVSWKSNESVVLEANPKFRLGAPANKRVIVRHVPETAAQLLLLEKGDVDIAFDLSPDQLATLAGKTDIKVESFPSSDTYYMGLNVADDRLKNPKVREALKYLVDYKGMADSFLKGRFIVHETFLPEGFMGALDYNPYKLDVAKAKALLAEAGYPNGFDLTLEASNNSPFTDMAQSIQQTIGAGRHQDHHLVEGNEVGPSRLPRAQAPGAADLLGAGLLRPAHQRRHLRAQHRQFRQGGDQAAGVAQFLVHSRHQQGNRRGGARNRTPPSARHSTRICNAR